MICHSRSIVAEVSLIPCRSQFSTNPRPLVPEYELSVGHLLHMLCHPHYIPYNLWFCCVDLMVFVSKCVTWRKLDGTMREDLASSELFVIPSLTFRLHVVSLWIRSKKVWPAIGQSRLEFDCNLWALSFVSRCASKSWYHLKLCAYIYSKSRTSLIVSANLLQSLR